MDEKHVDGARKTPADHLLQFFHYSHLQNQEMREVSKGFADLAMKIVATTPTGPEQTVCLRKLLEAKDCGVRTLVDNGTLKELRKMGADARRAVEP